MLFLLFYRLSVSIKLTMCFFFFHLSLAIVSCLLITIVCVVLFLELKWFSFVLCMFDGFNQKIRINCLLWLVSIDDSVYKIFIPLVYQIHCGCCRLIKFYSSGISPLCCDVIWIIFNYSQFLAGSRRIDLSGINFKVVEEGGLIL